MDIIGVDGCPGGWIAAQWEGDANKFTSRFHSSFDNVVTSYPASAYIGVDMPIGLTDARARTCDLEARLCLGWPRGASVFVTPVREVIAIEHLGYELALRTSRAVTQRGISKQAHSISRRIKEVDCVMTPELQRRVVEVHPEVTFWAMAGKQPMRYRKTREEGFAERRDVLLIEFAGANVPSTRPDAKRMAPEAKPDDLLDAMAAAWTARRVARRQESRLPNDPPTDARGLRMEIVY